MDAKLTNGGTKRTLLKYTGRCCSSSSTCKLLDRTNNHAVSFMSKTIMISCYLTSMYSYSSYQYTNTPVIQVVAFTTTSSFLFKKRLKGRQNCSMKRVMVVSSLMGQKEDDEETFDQILVVEKQFLPPELIYDAQINERTISPSELGNSHVDEEKLSSNLNKKHISSEFASIQQAKLVIKNKTFDNDKKNTDDCATKSSQKSSSTTIRRPQTQQHRTTDETSRTGFNVVLTHCTADFDSLASAVGLAKLWSNDHSNSIPSPLKRHHHHPNSNNKNINNSVNQHSQESLSLPTSVLHDNSNNINKKSFDSASHVPTFVVLPRGAHPGVQKFLALHKHLFPIRSLKSLPDDITSLNRLALVDAQRRDRIGPAVSLLEHANRVTVVDHHVDQDSDIDATDYVVDKVGSVSTIIVERLIDAGIQLTEAEATLMALGIHGDTGSLRYDSTTVRDAKALAWCLEAGASQVAIAEHAQVSLSTEQQSVLTQALIHTNTTMIHGVSVGTVLLHADGFIQGLAAVTQDALDLSSSDVYLLALVYEAKKSSSSNAVNSTNKKKKNMTKREKDQQNAAILTSRVLASIHADDVGLVDKEKSDDSKKENNYDENIDQQHNERETNQVSSTTTGSPLMKRLRLAFDRIDVTKTGYIEHTDVAYAMSTSGIVLTGPSSSVSDLIDAVDNDGDGKIDFHEFVEFVKKAEIVPPEEFDERNHTRNTNKHTNKDGTGRSNSSTNNHNPYTMIIVGRVKAGMNVKGVKLNKLFEPYGGGGHPKAAAVTVRVPNEQQAQVLLQTLVDDLIQTSFQTQLTVGDFMTAPVLAVNYNMNEKQVIDLFRRYNVRALPVVDNDNNVIGLVSSKIVEAAKQRQFNKDQKRIRQQQQQQQQQDEEERLVVGVDNSYSDGNNTNIPHQPHQRQREQHHGNTTLGNSSSGSSTSTTEKSSRRTTTTGSSSNNGNGNGSAVKGWMLQHVQTVEASMSLSQVEALLYETDVGSIPVVADGTKQLVGMVTRTDILRQRRYYQGNSFIPYHNKGYSNSIAERKPIIELRKKLKQFDLD